MKLTHLSEAEIQLYAEQRLSNAERKNHLTDCSDCQTAVATYISMFKLIHEMERPTFDFDIAGLVLAQLPEAKPQYPWLPALAAALSIIFSAALAFFYGPLIIELLSEMSQIWMLVVLCPTLIISAIQCLTVYWDYHEKINILNHHDFAT